MCDAHHPLDPGKVLLELRIQVAVAVRQRDPAVVGARQRRIAHRHLPAHCQLQTKASQAQLYLAETRHSHKEFPLPHK